MTGATMVPHGVNRFSADRPSQPSRGLKVAQWHSLAESHPRFQGETILPRPASNHVQADLGTI